MSLYTPSELERIERATSRFHFMKMADDGVLEIFADHHMLNTLRTCEAKFEQEIINNTIPRGKVWPLSFGIFFHQCMEWFDEAEDKNFTGEWNEPYGVEIILAKQWQVDPWAEGIAVQQHPEDPKITQDVFVFKKINMVTWISRCRNFWTINKLDEFKDLPNYKELNGWQGAMSLLMQYWDKYGNEKERLRTVGNELCFGKNREVPILTNPILFPWAPFRCYLTGRIDRVVDNRIVIGPMDRKTHRAFKGGEDDKYKPHDAFVGYVYSLQRILPDIQGAENRKCDSVIIDMIQLAEVTEKTKNKVRFKRAYKQYYPEEMLEFVDRQISTFSMMYDLIVKERPAQWNTSACHNQFFRNCPYKVLHEQSPAGRESVLKTFYQQREKPWTPFVTREDKNLVQFLDAVE